MTLLRGTPLLLLLVAGLNASTIVISQGDTPGDFSQTMTGPDGFTAYVDVGWTTGGTSYTNVTITATLMGQDSTDQVDAYLTTQRGSGTTAGANGVAAATGIVVPTSGYGVVTLFTGLTLNANTSYYLTLAPAGSGQMLWGIDDAQPSPIADAGVTPISADFCTEDGPGCDAYPPASPWGGLGANPIFSVTSNPASVPEPATAALMSAGAVLLVLLRRFRRGR